MTDENKAPSADAKRGMTDWFREAWSQAIVAVSTAEEEAGKVLHKAGDLAGWGPEEAKRLAKDFSEKLISQRKDLEKSLDDQVHKTLSRMKVPRRDEIEALQARVAKAAERIEALESKRN